MPELDTTKLRARLVRLVPVHVADQIAEEVLDSLWLAEHDQAIEKPLNDNINALRAELRSVKSFLRMEREAARQNLARAEAAEAALAKRNRIIAEAPHEDDCGGWVSGDYGVHWGSECTCFKSQIEEAR